VKSRVTRMLGHEAFSLEWVSIYRFQCRRLERFIHDRVIFAGDSAHQVSPFGARGANSGVQDAENLGWKLAATIKGQAGLALLSSYDHERSAAADENIMHSTRATDFLAPHSEAEQIMRNAVLDLARETAFAKRMVNSGRLSVPTAYADSPLSTPDQEAWDGGVKPGAPVPDAPLRDGSGRTLFLSEALGPDFTLLHRANGQAKDLQAEDLPGGIKPIAIGDDHLDPEGLLVQRYALPEGGSVLIRPDGHVAARFGSFDRARLDEALHRAMGDRR